MIGEGLLTKIRSYFKIRLEEDEKILLDERGEVTPSLIVGCLIFLGILYLPLLLELRVPRIWKLFLFTFFGVLLWFTLVPIRRVIITDKRCIFKMYFVFSVPLENFKTARKPKIGDFLRPPSASPFLQWFVIPSSILFKDVVSVIYSNFFIYICVSNREKFITEFNKTLLAHKLPEGKIKPLERRSVGNRIVSVVKQQIFNSHINETVLLIVFLYLSVTMGFLTLIFASPVHIGSLNRGDVGKYVVVTGELINVHESNAPFIGKDILWIMEGNSILLGEYNGFIVDDIYNEGLFFEKPVTVSGKLVLKENKLYLNAHFLNMRPTKLLLFSIIILIYLSLIRLGRIITK